MSAIGAIFRAVRNSSSNPSQQNTDFNAIQPGDLKLVVAVSLNGVQFTTADKIQCLNPCEIIYSFPNLYEMHDDKNYDQQEIKRRIESFSNNPEIYYRTKFKKKIFKAKKNIEDINKLLYSSQNNFIHLLDIKNNLIFLEKTLKEALEILGKTVAVFGHELENVSEDIKTFNQIFFQAYELNRNFEEKKKENLSLLDPKSLKCLGKSSAETLYKLWAHPVFGRMLSLSISYYLLPSLGAIISSTFQASAAAGAVGIGFFTTQLGQTLIIDDVLRWITESFINPKKELILFNFANGQPLQYQTSNTKVDVGKTKEQIKKTKKLQNLKNELEENKNQLERLTKLKEDLVKKRNLSSFSFTNFFKSNTKAFNYSDDHLINEINTLFENLIFNGWLRSIEPQNANYLKNDQGNICQDANGLPILDESKNISIEIEGKQIIVEVDKNGNPICDKLNNGNIYNKRDLTDKKKIETLIKICETCISRYEQEIYELENMIARIQFKNREVINYNPRESSTRTNYSEYTKDERRKLFSQLAASQIQNKLILDSKTQTFLNHLCEHCKDEYYPPEDQFKNFIKNQFYIYISRTPKEQLMQALIEYYSKNFFYNNGR